MPRTHILHHGSITQYTARDVAAEISSLPPGYYKIIALERRPRNSQGTTIHVSTEIRAEINALRDKVYADCKNRLTQDDVIAHLLDAYRHCGANLCDW